MITEIVIIVKVTKTPFNLIWDMHIIGNGGRIDYVDLIEFRCRKQKLFHSGHFIFLPKNTNKVIV
jgi:hypothetical protein